MTAARVLVAHGWLGGPWQVMPLARRLSVAGFDATTVSYRSAFGSFAAAVEAVRRAALLSDQPLHLVGFSMGGLVMRAVAVETPDVVSLLLIGTPNTGSPLADVACRVAPTSALRRLSTDAGPLPPPLPHIRVGCIAGSGAGPWGLMFHGANDERVAVTSALGVAHHASAIIPVGHTRLAFSRETATLAVAFLRSGSFPLVATRASAA